MLVAVTYIYDTKYTVQYKDATSDGAAPNTFNLCSAYRPEVELHEIRVPVLCWKICGTHSHVSELQTSGLEYFVRSWV